nr:hypothetical protein [Tanacetum cinerariifolium]
KFKIQQYLQNEHYALWEVIEFGDFYKAPPEESGKGPASESYAKKKGRTVVITTEDMQKRRNDVKARTTLLLALPDEHQLRFSKYETAKELWEAILKTFGGNEATKKTKNNQLKQQYGNFKAEGSETLEQTFNRLQAIIKYEDITQIDEDDIEEIDIKWNMTLLSMRADRFWKKTGKKITIQGSDVAVLKLFGYFTVSFHFIVIPLDHQRKNIENLIIKIRKLKEELSDSENKLCHYKIGLSQVEARLVEFKTQEIKFCEKIRGLEKDVETRLSEFVDDTVIDYSRPTPSIDSSKSNTSDLQSSNFSVFEHGESSGSIMSKPMIKQVNTARPKAVINAVRTNRFNDVKASTCLVWKPIKPNSASITLKRYDYVDVRGRSRSVMTWVPKKVYFSYVKGNSGTKLEESVRLNSPEDKKKQS